MTTPRRAASSAPTLDECKIRASLLLKDLRSADRSRSLPTAERLLLLPQFAEQPAETLLLRSDAVRRKHALAVVAAELGYAAWTDCKRRLEIPAADRLDTKKFFVAADAFLNRWFARYGEARASLEALGGFLFPFRRQFFVCEAGMLEALAVDPADPDWERIGRDWVRPGDEAVRERLERKMLALGYGG